MSLTLAVSLASNVLLLFKTYLQEQLRELKNAIDRAHKEIRSFADSGPELLAKAAP